MSNNKDSLGDRMKEYEYVTRNYLTRKLPVILRLDGKAFHSFTRGLKKPFDYIFVNSMQNTMKYLCENIQGCVIGYTQSDEITLVLVDYQNREASAWFDYEVQKMCSIAASMATMAFNKFFYKNVENWGYDNIPDWSCGGTNEPVDEKLWKQANVYLKACEKGAMFDARVFSIPKEEVANCLIWRQQDATRNSIQSVGQANFSHTQLHGKNCSNIQDMLMLEKGINWNDYPTHLKRGSCCIKKSFKINEGTEQEAIRNKWVIDTEIPIFTQDKDYVNKLIFI